MGPLLQQAQSLCAAGRHETAAELLEPYAAPPGRFDAARALHMDVLLALGRRAEAEGAFDRTLHGPNTSPDDLEGLAFFARRLERYELSRDLYDRAARLAPSDAQLWYNLASAERSLGRLAEAAEACHRALAAEPDHAPAVLMRSELLPATEERNHVGDLQARLAAGRTEQAQMFAAYALGKELHELRRYDEAFDAFVHGSRIRRANLAYEVLVDERKLARIQEVYDTSPAMTAQASTRTGRHIFIIGLPRSGTTLTERLLSALPGVRSNGETDNLSAALLQCAPQGPGDVFDRCARASAACVAERYDALAGRGSDAERVIEKLPLNYLYVGAIAAAFPSSPIILVRRHPLDSCFAMFRILFGEGYPFSYDLDDLARYYAAYDRLMNHWRRILPGRLIELDYEDLVSAPRAVGRSLAEACGLSWTEDALDLSRNRAPSSTASAAQVRGAIYPTSAGVWKRYRRHLAPLIWRLQQLGVSVPDADSA